LVRLAFSYVMHHGFARYSSMFVPKLFPTSSTAHRIADELAPTPRLHYDEEVEKSPEKLKLPIAYKCLLFVR
jgi:hypothetical protein